MDIQGLHKLIDDWADKQPQFTLGSSAGETVIGFIPSETTEPEVARDLPEGKRVVRTPTSGDRVYLLDEVKKTRQWVATPEALTGLGFEQTDVGEVTDTDLYKYSMGATIYKVE